MAMVKTIIKIVIAALVVHACWRSANVVMRYSKFKDAVHETLLFHSNMPDAELQDRVIELAQQYDVPLQPERLTIQRIANRTIVDAVYTDQVELIPTKMFPWKFTMNVEVVNVNLVGPNDATPGR
jgi:hypothetical protein